MVHLTVASPQGVGRLIEASYGKKAKLPANITATSRFKQAGQAKVKRFNAHIEIWLFAVNKIVPILIAYRRQDWEAGGTELSKWHYYSIANVESVIKQLNKSNKSEAEVFMIKGIKEELKAVKNI